jgi:hypothetical protein
MSNDYSLGTFLLKFLVMLTFLVFLNFDFLLMLITNSISKYSSFLNCYKLMEKLK